MEASGSRRIKGIEEDSTHLKRMFADLTLTLILILTQGATLDIIKKGLVSGRRYKAAINLATRGSPVE